MVIVDEAGGRITYFGCRRAADGGNAIASNGLTHDAALETINTRLVDPDERNGQ